MDPTPIANGLASNPLAWMLALALVAIGYLFRLVIATNAKLIEAHQTNSKEQREILSQIIPLVTQLTEAIEILERLTDTERSD